MSDPFERAKAIRRGELDDQMPDHDELVAWLLRIPLTWGGSMLRTVVARMAVEPFFKDDAALHGFVDRCMADARNPMSPLRME